MKSLNPFSLQLFLLQLFTFFSFATFAADTTQTWNDLLKDFKTKEISIDWINPSIDRNIIKEVEIFDMRPDTAHIGMFSNNFYKPTKLVFSDGLLLPDIFKRKLSNMDSAGNSILLIVRDYWMNDVSTQASTASSTDKSIRTDRQTSKVICRVDIFLKQDDKYVPLTRVDTIIWDKKILSYTSVALFEKSLEAIHDEIKTALTETSYLKRKKESKQTIVDNYTAKLALPTNSVTFAKKGLYSSFEQFKKNQPISENFRIKHYGDEPPTLFIIDEKGNETLTRNVWGVCDGKEMFKMQNGLLFKLYRHQNAYYWMGLKEYDQVSYKVPLAVPGSGGLVSMTQVASDLKIGLTPNLLNMSTGKEY